MTKQLSTDRLIIRRFSPADLDDFCAYQADPRVRKHLPGEPMDVGQVAQYLAAQAVLDEGQLEAWHGYAVELVETGTVIGDVGVYRVSAAEGDVGFQFHPGFHHQGYGREATTAFLAYLFEDLGLERVTAGCDQANEASRTLLVSLGLRPQSPSADGSCHFELSRDEWLGQR
ncbi:GNAT family N-acetyltransferase [Kribbella sp. NPDC056861]|uniref:GNAT family N-acetyltransferase n=1 Tax=Kribbella sp. NPDC056861 TaxID=3154857 RepID=UPI00342807A8